jgi:hypothetical protein
MKGSIMALTKISLRISARPVMTFLDEDNEFDMEQPYQRGLVWNENRKRSLIESLLDGTPIPAIIMNDRWNAGFKEEGYSVGRLSAYAIVDGKQRITAIQDLVADAFTIPANWFDPDSINENAHGKENIVWSDLTVAERRHIKMFPIPVAEGRFDSLEGEKRIFDRVNFGGVAQGESDL